MMGPRFDLAPLAALAGVPLSSLGKRLNLSGTTWKQARDNGVGLVAAERYAVRLGLHPAIVWPEWMRESTLAASVVCLGCEGRFVPLRKSHRYCTKDCYQRKYKREKYRARYASDPEFRARELAKSAAYKAENRRATLTKSKAYYQANKKVWVEGRARRKAERNPQAQSPSAAQGTDGTVAA